MQSAFYEFLKDGGSADVIGVADENDAFLVSHVAKYMGKKTYVLPDFRANIGDDLLCYEEELQQLLTVIRSYYEDKSTKKIIISPLRALFSPLPSKKLLSTKLLEFGDRLKLLDFKNDMYNWGYTVVDIVQSRGEVSFRGDIVDIFPIDLKFAIRISLFDDEIESIREFECETQKSKKEELDSVRIAPALFALSSKEFDELNEKIQDIDSDSFVKSVNSLGLWALEDKCTSYFDTFEIKLMHSLEEEIEEISFFDNSRKETLSSLSVIGFAKEFKPISTSINTIFLDFHKNKRITLLAKNEILLKQAQIDVNYDFKQSDLIVNIIGHSEMIISLNKKGKRLRKKRASIILDELRIGDLVVHENYGVGLFKGLENTTVLGSTREFVVVGYQGDDRLLVPVENLNVIDRYISDGGHLGIVDKLGKGSFSKLKAKTKEKLLEIASKIVSTAAKREMISAVVLNQPKEIVEFQKDAGFEYTDDQQKSIDEIFADLKSSKMMDRLLSGDVGFGKTEVAMNAMFLSALNGYQSIMLAPTTLLSSQHFKSINERFKKYNIRVERLDRFTSAKSKSRILADLSNGELKICIGTHSLLGVELKKPALIVLDEEHKFGVKQKERLKQMRSDVHILSMSATPIPRSLNMALSSIKQYSQILTPPSEREDIRTFVKEYEIKSIKEAIARELRRGGQLFFVHNRIATIQSKKLELENAMKGIKIFSFALKNKFICNGKRDCKI